MKADHKDTPTLVSLFAGAGGLDLGLETAGFVTLAANDIEHHACETLRANKLLSSLSDKEFNDWFSKQVDQRCYRGSSPSEIAALRTRVERTRLDRKFLARASILEGEIRSLSSATIADAAGVRQGEVTLVAGGPPCQPFSRAGKRETVESEDGRLFLEFVRVVRDLRPRWFLFENVKGLLLSGTTVVGSRCSVCERQSLVSFNDRQAYLDGEPRILPCSCGNATPTLFDESRKGGSLDIIRSEFDSLGYKTYQTVLNAADFGAPQTRERVIIVGSRDGENFDWPLPTHGLGPTAQKQGAFDFLPKRKPWRSMFDALWAKGHPTFGNLDPETAVLWVKNVVRPHAEPVTWSLSRPSPTIGAHQAAKLAIAPDGVPEAQLRRQQWHLKGHRQGDLPPVFVKHEYLSDLELLTLQAFPSGWYLYGTRMQRAFQIGNAVPVTLGHALGKAIMSAMSVSASGHSDAIGKVTPHERRNAASIF